MDLGTRRPAQKRRRASHRSPWQRNRGWIGVGILLFGVRGLPVEPRPLPRRQRMPPGTSSTLSPATPGIPTGGATARHYADMHEVIERSLREDEAARPAPHRDEAKEAPGPRR